MSKRFFLIAFAAMMVTANGEAAPRVGNGGGVWTCENRGTREIRWLRFVDLFEAENEFGYKLEAIQGSPMEIAETKLLEAVSVSPALAEQLRQHPIHFSEVIRYIPRESGLTVIEDAAIRVFPLAESCEDGYLYYGQLANFTFDGRLLISSKFWYSSAFSDLERGALLVHEAIYKALREGAGDKDSSRVRKIVGVLFAKLSADERAQKIDSILAEAVPGR